MPIQSSLRRSAVGITVELLVGTDDMLLPWRVILLLKENNYLLKTFRFLKCRVFILGYDEYDGTIYRTSKQGQFLLIVPFSIVSSYHKFGRNSAWLYPFSTIFSPFESWESGLFSPAGLFCWGNRNGEIWALESMYIFNTIQNGT